MRIWPLLLATKVVACSINVFRSCEFVYNWHTAASVRSPSQTRNGRPLVTDQTSIARDARLYEAAWLHYCGNYSQKQIAERFDVNKATVSRWLSQAVAHGIVKTSVEAPGLNELEIRLRHAFGLRSAQVVPSLPIGSAASTEPETSWEEVRVLQNEELGRAAAKFLGPKLKGNMGLGLGGGTGVASFARHLPNHSPMVSLRLHALGVSSREPFAVCATSVTSTATALLTSEFQRRAAQSLHLKGRRHRIPAVEGNALRLPSGGNEIASLAMAADDYYDKAMREVDMVVTGIGAIETCWILDETEREYFAEQGAIGDVLYDLFGEGGTPIKMEPTAAVFSFGIDRLRSMVSNGKEVVAICCNKVEAIVHAFGSREAPFVTGIITDETTALRVLARFDETS